MLGPHRDRVLPVLLASLLVTTLFAAPALADNAKDSGMGVSLVGFGSFARLDEIGIAASDSDGEPDPLKGKNLHLEGGGHLFGGGLNALLMLWGVRAGLDFSVFGVDGTKLSHNALDNGLSMTASGAWGTSVGLFGGYERAVGPVRPYADLLINWTGFWLDVGLRHPELGKLGRTEYGGWLFGLGSRAGIRIPFASHAFFDLSVTYSFVGVEALRIAGAFGLAVN